MFVHCSAINLAFSWHLILYVSICVFVFVVIAPHRRRCRPCHHHFVVVIVTRAMYKERRATVLHETETIHQHFISDANCN